MRRGKKTVSLTLAIIGAVTCAAGTGCGRRNNSLVVPEDKSKTQLNIGIPNGGLGYQWLDPIIQRFEETYKDVSFETGKEGVQVRVFPEEKYKANNAGFEINVKDYAADVIFTEGSDYLDLHKAGVMLEMTDVVTATLQQDIIKAETNTAMESATIESKLTDSYKAYYKLDGAYYGLPYYNSQSGIVYDVSLFEKNGWYFSKDGTEDDPFVADGYTAEDLSAGPDGEFGTRDDGLPATYDEFFALCDEIYYTDGCIPIIWTGKVQSYATGLMYGLWADFEGKESMSLNFNFSGTASDIIDTINADGSYTLKDPVQINAQNGYELYGQAGRYHAIDFMQRLCADENYYDENICQSASTSHLKAQDEFLYSTFNVGTSSKTPIAMLIEGTWWENEATNTFNSMVSSSNDQKWSKQGRKFGLMPFPKATEDKVGEVNTTLGSETLVFINSNIAGMDYKVKLAKAFIQYSHTNQAMEDFAVATSSVRPFNQTVSQTNLDKMTYFGQSLYQDWTESEQVFGASQSSVYRQSPSTFSALSANGFMTSKTNTPSKWFYDNKGYSSVTYFNELRTYNDKTKWDTLFSSLY